jgi:hypothetical protein
MPVPAEPVRPVTEAAIGHALASHDRTSIQAGRHLTKNSGTAVTSFHKSHRYDADGPTPHHGQDDAARAFHVAALGVDSMLDCHLGMRAGGRASKSQVPHRIVRYESRLPLAAAGKMRCESMRKSTETASRHTARTGIRSSAG